MTLAHAFKKKGIQEGISKIALNMLLENSSIPFIAKVTGLSVAEIEKLKAEKIDVKD